MIYKDFNRKWNCVVWNNKENQVQRMVAKDILQYKLTQPQSSQLADNIAKAAIDFLKNASTSQNHTTPFKHTHQSEMQRLEDSDEYQTDNVYSSSAGHQLPNKKQKTDSHLTPHHSKPNVKQSEYSKPVKNHQNSTSSTSHSTLSQQKQQQHESKSAKHHSNKNHGLPSGPSFVFTGPIVLGNFYGTLPTASPPSSNDSEED